MDIPVGKQPYEMDRSAILRMLYYIFPDPGLKNPSKVSDEMVPTLPRLYVPLTNQIGIRRSSKSSNEPPKVLSIGLILSSTTAKLNDTRNTLTSTQNTLTSTQADLLATKTVLASTQSDLSASNKSLASTQAELSDIKTALASAQTQLSDTKASLATTQNILTTANNQLSISQSQLSTANSSLSTAQSKFGNAAGEINKAQAYLKVLASWNDNSTPWDQILNLVKVTFDPILVADFTNVMNTAAIYYSSNNLQNSNNYSNACIKFNLDLSADISNILQIVN